MPKKKENNIRTSITFTPRMYEVLLRDVEAGAYANISEIVRDAVRHTYWHRTAVAIDK